MDRLSEDIAAAEDRYARIIESTMEARQRRDSLAGEVMALYSERARLIEEISALRVSALELKFSPPAGPPPVPATLPPAIPPVLRPARTALSSAGALWSARAQSTAKPRNDSFGSGAHITWRQNEDRFRLTPTDDGVLAAVSDGAGASGLFCGAWAETLVGQLPATPLESLKAFNDWLDPFCLEFHTTHARHSKSDAAKHSKFVREGSCATLTVCWLRFSGSRAVLHWLGYGDSPLLVFDRSGGEPELIAGHPGSLGAFDRDPQLLNWKDMPDPGSLKTGSLPLPARATVILASDGIGQFTLLRALAAQRGGNGTLGAEFRRLETNGNGRLGTAVKSHAARAPQSFAAELAALGAALESESAFAALVASRCEEGLLANDDSTLIMIEIGSGC
ncbi:hypothetical protein CCP1ISM_10021 [Azospirillaceae bacterium]|nr:hypothetical protein MTCCP1_00022 [uncultured bacterium]